MKIIEFIDSLGRKRTTEGLTIGFTEHDPLIEESDRTHCRVCGREVSKTHWNYCVTCGMKIEKEVK